MNDQTSPPIPIYSPACIASESATLIFEEERGRGGKVAWRGSGRRRWVLDLGMEWILVGSGWVLCGWKGVGKGKERRGRGKQTERYVWDVILPEEAQSSFSSHIGLRLRARIRVLSTTLDGNSTGTI